MRSYAGSFVRAVSVALISSTGIASQALADDRGVIIPPGADPVIHTLVAQLHGDFSGLPTQEDPRFGQSVALHGDTLAVGAPGTMTGSGDNIFQRGAVFLYRRHAENGSWQFLQRIAIGSGGNGQCGTSVALNDDSLLVGCPYHEVSGVARGRAIMYTRNASTGEFVDGSSYVDQSQQAGARCGTSVALIDSAPGTGSPYPMAAVSCPSRRDFPGGQVGLVGGIDIYWNPVNWSLATRLVGPAIADVGFGQSIDFNRAGPSPGMTLLLAVGIPGVGDAVGGARVYAMGANVQTWTQEHALTGPGAGSRFGFSVDMNLGRLAVGAPERRTLLSGSNPPTTVASGSVTVATRACNFQGVCGWSAPTTELTMVTLPIGQPVPQNRLGNAVLVAEPSRVFAGAPMYPWPTFAGQGRHYVLDGSDWLLNEDEPFHPVGPGLPTSEFGTAAAGDADWLAVGAPGYPDADGQHGRVFVYAYDYDDTIFFNGFEEEPLGEH